ncbi:MAG: hypothetical protein M3527_02095, partial [Actinomycetota bacterium]|nr:hypothetical protein [Actinomycetota bacterium]
MPRRWVLAAALVAAFGALLPGTVARAQAGPPVCGPGGPPVTFAGTAMPADAKSYLALEFAVAAGTTRVEATYAWTDRPGLPATPLTGT